MPPDPPPVHVPLMKTGTLATRLDSLEQTGRLIDAIELASMVNRTRPDPALEARLVTLRYRTARATRTHTPTEGWPPSEPDRFPHAETLPEVAPSELSAGSMRAAIQHHGALVVRRLIEPERARSLAEGVEHALEAYDQRAGAATDMRHGDGPDDGWFIPLELPAHEAAELPRDWLRSQGSILTADSPRMLFSLLELYQEVGLMERVREHLGERPFLSATKCTLRRTIPPGADQGWHQDGRFLRRDGPVRTVNVWLALSSCGAGTDAPGMEILPRRLPGILATGTDGADRDWVVGSGVVEREVEATGTPVIHPRFDPGDAIIFDDVLLHRTAPGEGMSAPRHAIETWFFAPSTFPASYPPLLV